MSTKTELEKLIPKLEKAHNELAELYKDLDNLVNDEETEIEGLENVDSDTNIARAERAETLRETVNSLDEALTLIEDDVVSKLKE